MNRLSVRLLLSHVLVAAVAGLTTYLLVRVLAPQMYDRDVHQMGPGPGGMGMAGALRGVAVAAMNNAVLIGVLAGIVVAVVASAVAAGRIMRPLEAVSAATHRMAEGRYDHRVNVPRESELAAVARDVNTLGERLAETEARRVRLLSEVAHELRTPLTVLDGYVEGLVDGVFEPGPEVLMEMSGEVRRLRRLADDLSELSRAEEGRLDLRLEIVDLADVAANATDRLRPQLDDAGIILTVIRGPEQLLVPGDPDRLGQLVTNLVGNALAATPRGGSVRVEARRAGGYAVVTVTDTGVGLTREDLAHIFERFYRVPGSGVEHAHPGSGIGLTIALGIAVAHGGDLTATSPGMGSGATFTLRVPLHRSR
ncbi:MAG: sensor histidine kinase [Jiangellaceae bacterium]